MWNLVAAAISFMCMAAFGSLPTFGQSFRIATYNVNFANTRGDQVLAAIGESNPDILCFQETTVQSENWLRKQLVTCYPEFPSVGHEGKYYAERFAFASKFKPVSASYHPPVHGSDHFMVVSELKFVK